MQVDLAPAPDLLLQRLGRLPVLQVRAPVEAVNARQGLHALAPQRLGVLLFPREGRMGIPHEEHATRQPLHDDERDAEPVFVLVRPGDVGHRQARRMQRAQQRRLPVDVGVAAARDAGRRNLQHVATGELVFALAAGFEQEGQAGVSVGFVQAGELEFGPHPVMDEGLEIVPELFLEHGVPGFPVTRRCASADPAPVV